MLTRIVKDCILDGVKKNLIPEYNNFLSLREKITKKVSDIIINNLTPHDKYLIKKIPLDNIYRIYSIDLSTVTDEGGTVYSATYKNSIGDRELLRKCNLVDCNNVFYPRVFNNRSTINEISLIYPDYKKELIELTKDCIKNYNIYDRKIYVLSSTIDDPYLTITDIREYFPELCNYFNK